MSGVALSDAGRAAAEIVDAFARHDRERYFAGFADDATFLFHAAPELLRSRAEYEDQWRSWEAEGFRVVGCRTSDADLRMIADGVAVLTHRVRTRLAGADEELRERETIVLRRESDGRWLGVHEHLSPES